MQHHNVLGHRQHPGVEDYGNHQHDDGSQDDGEVNLVLLPAVQQLQLRSTLLQLEQFTWRDVAKVEGVEEDEPPVGVVVDADVQELVPHEADEGKPGRLVAWKDRHHLCSYS